MHPLYGYVVLALGTFGMVLTGPGQTASIGATITVVIANSHLPRTFVSGLYLAATLGSACSLPAIGYAVDRIGSRVMFPVMAAVLGFSCFLFASLFHAHLEATAIASKVDSTRLPGSTTRERAKETTQKSEKDTAIFDQEQGSPMLLLLTFFLLRVSAQGGLWLVGTNMVNRWFVKTRAQMMGVLNVVVSFALTGVFSSIVKQSVLQIGFPKTYQNLGRLELGILLPLGLLFAADSPEKYGLKPDNEGRLETGTSPEGDRDVVAQPRGQQQEDTAPEVGKNVDSSSIDQMNAISIQPVKNEYETDVRKHPSGKGDDIDILPLSDGLVAGAALAGPAEGDDVNNVTSHPEDIHFDEEEEADDTGSPRSPAAEDTLRKSPSRNSLLPRVPWKHGSPRYKMVQKVEMVPLGRQGEELDVKTEHNFARKASDAHPGRGQADSVDISSHATASMSEGPAAPGVAETLEVNKTLSDALRTYAFWFFVHGMVMQGIVITAMFFHLDNLLGGFPPSLLIYVYLSAATGAGIGSIGIGLLTRPDQRNVGGTGATRSGTRFSVSFEKWVAVEAGCIFLMLVSYAAGLRYFLSVDKHPVPVIDVDSLDTEAVRVWMMWCGCLQGAAGGIITTVHNVVYAAKFGRLHNGKIQGIANSFMVASSALGPFLFSLIHDVLDNRYDYSLLAFSPWPVFLLFTALRI
ncbi:unnamed protein product [Amoebophrya sp. A120]|nr:unnamed protein product [Amoebophrya sp. A120]|eukprot:GSA120T00016719001.1